MTPHPADSSKLRCFAEIDGAALRHNAAVAGRLAGGGPECVMAVVKANGYGHGTALVVAALKEEIGAFAVACLSEALEVKSHAVRARDGGCAPILILSPALPAEMAEIVRHGFIPAISTVEEVEQFAAAAGETTCAVHLVVDTGMGRMGALPDQAAAVLRAVKSSRTLTLDSVASHFPSSDEDEDFTRDQERRFREMTARWKEEFGPFRTHIANSAAVLHYPRQKGEMVRSGLMLYGVSPLPDYQSLLRPVMTWKSRVSLVRQLPTGHSISYGRTFTTPRPMAVASLSAGYGDGYPRQVSGKGGSVLLGGKRCAILGRVTMDQILVDVTGLIPAPTAGDEAVLLGSQADEFIAVGEIARLAATIPWHVFTGITCRTARLAMVSPD